MNIKQMPTQDINPYLTQTPGLPACHYSHLEGDADAHGWAQAFLHVTMQLPSLRRGHAVVAAAHAYLHRRAVGWHVGGHAGGVSRGVRAEGAGRWRRSVAACNHCLQTPWTGRHGYWGGGTGRNAKLCALLLQVPLFCPASHLLHSSGDTAGLCCQCCLRIGSSQPHSYQVSRKLRLMHRKPSLQGSGKMGDGGPDTEQHARQERNTTEQLAL